MAGSQVEKVSLRSRSLMIALQRPELAGVPIKTIKNKNQEL